MSRSLSNKDAGFRNKQERAEYFLLDERRLRQTKVTDLDRKLWEKVIQFSDFFEDILSWSVKYRMTTEMRSLLPQFCLLDSTILIITASITASER